MAAENEDETEVKLLPVETIVKDTGVWEKSVHVSVAAEEVAREFNAVLGEYASKVNLPGFRAGKVPREVVERKFGADVKRQVAGNLLQRAVYSAIEKDDLNTIGEPQFEAPDSIAATRGQAFTFEFKTEVYPQFELPPYTGLKAEQEEIDVLPEETESAMNGIRERFAVEGPALEDHGVANKDSATGILRVLVDGNEVHDETAARLLCVDGHVFGAHAHLADTFLLGAKKGDKRVIEETLSESFPIVEHKGKKATIEFEVTEVRQLHLPEIDDELAKKVGLNDVASLKEKVHASLLQKVRDTIMDRVSSTLLAQVEDKVTFELPPRALNAAAINNMKQNIQQMSQMGMSPQALGITGEMMKAESLEHGSKELRRFFILSAIADEEELFAEDEEVDDVVVNLARQQNVPVQQLFDKMSDEGQIEQIETNIRFKKAMEFITDNAEVTVVARKPFKQHDDHAGHDHGGHELTEAGPEHSLEQGHEHGGEGHDCAHDHGDAGHAHDGHDCAHDHGDAGHAHEKPKADAGKAEPGHEHGSHA